MPRPQTALADWRDAPIYLGHARTEQPCIWSHYARGLMWDGARVIAGIKNRNGQKIYKQNIIIKIMADLVIIDTVSCQIEEHNTSMHKYSIFGG